MVKVFKTHLHSLRALSIRPLVRLSLVLLLATQCFYHDYTWVDAPWEMLKRLSLAFKPTYGPSFETMVSKHNYDFSKAKMAFDRKLPLERIRELSAEDFHGLLLANVPATIAVKMKRHLPTILHFSEKNQLDPLWVLSVIWVESHFKESATSRVRAAGLMQIMPKTGKYLNELLNVRLPLYVSHQVNYDPYHNIELGTFYLKKLHRRFYGRYDHATVAYNMGPTYTKRRLRINRRRVGSKNQYLIKVRKSYRVLSGPLKAHFLKRGIVLIASKR
jgi:soluble lytic murein transglycosylase-like protein